jgi:hypothetical protein
MSTGQPTVYLHVGAPKTGTTFLQAVAAKNRRWLRNEGLLYPGLRGDHFLEAQDVCGAFKGYRDPRVEGSWNRLLKAIDSWGGPAVLVSHELFTAATPEEIATIVTDLPTEDLRIVVTARDFARQLPAVWQEDLKNGSTLQLRQYLRRVRRTRAEAPGKRRGFWRWQDLPTVLAGWQRHVPAEQITVVTVPPKGSSPSLLWERFASAVGVPPDGADLEVRRTNVSLDAASAEVVRRLNVALTHDGTLGIEWPVYRSEVKKFVAEKVLAGDRSAQPVSVGAEALSWAEELGREVASTVQDRGYRVVGDLDELVPSVDPAGPERPTRVDARAARDAAVRALSAYRSRVHSMQGTP